VDTSSPSAKPTPPACVDRAELDCLTQNLRDTTASYQRAAEAGRATVFVVDQ
jgi:hypothetical protein